MLTCKLFRIEWKCSMYDSVTLREQIHLCGIGSFHGNIPERYCSRPCKFDRFKDTSIHLIIVHRPFKIKLNFNCFTKSKNAKGACKNAKSMDFSSGNHSEHVVVIGECEWPGRQKQFYCDLLLLHNIIDVSD